MHNRKFLIQAIFLYEWQINITKYKHSNFGFNIRVGQVKVSKYMIVRVAENSEKSKPKAETIFCSNSINQNQVNMVKVERRKPRATTSGQPQHDKDRRSDWVLRFRCESQETWNTTRWAEANSQLTF